MAKTANNGLGSLATESIGSGDFNRNTTIILLTQSDGSDTEQTQWVVVVSAVDIRLIVVYKGVVCRLVRITCTISVSINNDRLYEVNGHVLC